MRTRAAPIDRIVQHCDILTIRGDSYRMLQHIDLWRALHGSQDPDAGRQRRPTSLVRRWRRTEACALAELSDSLLRNSTALTRMLLLKHRMRITKGKRAL